MKSWIIQIKRFFLKRQRKCLSFKKLILSLKASINNVFLVKIGMIKKYVVWIIRKKRAMKIIFNEFCLIKKLKRMKKPIIKR